MRMLERPLNTTFIKPGVVVSAAVCGSVQCAVCGIKLYMIIYPSKTLGPFVCLEKVKGFVQHMDSLVTVNRMKVGKIIPSSWLAKQ